MMKKHEGQEHHTKAAQVDLSSMSKFLDILVETSHQDPQLSEDRWDDGH